MNRILIATLAMLSIAPAVRADEEPATTPSADVAALEGRVTSVEEQYAETKATVAALSKLKWSGYVQARYAYLQCIGKAPAGCSYNSYWSASTTPSTGPDKDNFFVRRGRLKLVYDANPVQFVVQFDALPSGVSVKEAYASVQLPKLAGLSTLAIDAGLQGIPFGYDVGVRSSADLDLLERYRGVEVWLKGEYDVGVALRAARGPVSFRGGIFNGNANPGTNGGRDNDNLKDFIGRAAVDLGVVTGGVSGWYGKTRDWSAADDKTYDRKRIGADVQVYLDLLPIGGTAVKGEVIFGTTAIDKGVAGGKALGVAGHAWHATVTQNLGKRLQLAARYESLVEDHNLESSGLAVKEIRQLDVAGHYYLGGNYKLSALYSHPMNGKKVGPGSGTPSGTVEKTDVFVVQAQAKF